MSIDCLCDARIAVAQTFLPYFQRCAESVHHRCVGVSEGMETVALRYLNAQFFEQRFEFPLEQKIRVPGRATLRSKEQPPFVRSPRFEEEGQMLARWIGELDGPYGCFRRLVVSANSFSNLRMEYSINLRLQARPQLPFKEKGTVRGSAMRWCRLVLLKIAPYRHHRKFT